MKPFSFSMPSLVVLMASALTCVPAAEAQDPRARDLGIPFAGRPGALNAITDVGGVEVGQVTLSRAPGR